jgi:competence protein ComFC
MIEKIKFILTNIQSLIFPSFCESCSEHINNDQLFCENCADSIEKISSVSLKISASQSLTVHAFSKYSGTIKKLILRKNNGQQKTFEKLARLTLRNISPNLVKADYFIPIPLHWSRKLWRGYNQAEILAKEYADISNQMILDSMIRINKTKPQSSLNKEDRQLNVKDVFNIEKVMGEKLYGKEIILVDDVMTTGATLVEAARLLYKYNPKKITALVVCR